MDASKFGPGRAGRLVRVNLPEPDWAFEPSPLPASWELPMRLVPLLTRAYQLLGKLDGIGVNLKTPELLLAPLRNNEALASSRIEGTFATAEQLLLFAERPVEPQSARDPHNAWREVWNYADTLRFGWQALRSESLSLSLIRRMHQLMLGGVQGIRFEIGAFRRHQNAIGSRRFLPPPPGALADLLDNLQTYMNRRHPSDTADPLIRCFKAHYQFEAIHPFPDGNGRIGRIVLTLLISQAMQHKHPWLYLSPFFERNKEEYISRLFQVSANGQWTEWVEFCLRGTIERAEDSIARYAELLALREAFHKRVGEEGSSRTHGIVESLFESPFVAPAQLARKQGVYYQTAKADLDFLVSKGILERLDRVRPTTYLSTEVYAIAYRDRLNEIDDAAVSAKQPEQ